MASDSSEGRTFLGAGIAFPIQVDASGRVVMNTLEEHIRQSIRLIVLTAQGERVMRPDFGSGLHQLAFEPVTANTAALVKHRVQQALVRFEPRIDVLAVEVFLDPKQLAEFGVNLGNQGYGVLLIHVNYRVRATDSQFNLVFPFYLERGEL